MGHRISAFLAALILALGLAVAPVAAEPIHNAAYLGDVANLKKLLASGVKVDARDEYGHTPLHRARTAEIAKVLLKAGAKVDSRDNKGYTPLHFASAEIATVLLKAGAKVNARDQFGYTPLHAAGDVAAVKVLLKAGAKFDARSTNGVTPLHMAAWTGRADVIKFLLSAGAAANAKDKDGKTPFDFAKDHDTLKGTDVYRELREAQYD